MRKSAKSVIFHVHVTTQVFLSKNNCHLLHIDRHDAAKIAENLAS